MKFTLGEVRKAFTRKRFKKFAITVAELAISTAVVGGVAVLTLGSVNNAIQTKAMNTQETLLNNDLSIALANMQSKGKLAGHKTQESFVNELKNYYEIKEVLTTPEQVSKNFAPEYTIAGNTYKPDDFDIKFVTAKGESVALTYDTKFKASTQFAYDASGVNRLNGVSLAARNSAMGAVKGIYDVNGTKGPNKEGKDVGMLSTLKSPCNNVNLISLGGENCPNDFDPPVEVCDCAVNPDMEQCKDPVVTDYCDEHPTERHCICMKNPADPVCVDPTPTEDVPDPGCQDIDCSNPENETHPCCYDPVVEPCCALTDDNCMAQNRTLDKDKCECVCKKPKRQGNLVLDEATCTYICDKDLSKFNPNYTDVEKSKQECTCVPKDEDARERCRENGGKWDDSICSCICTDATRNKCKEDSCGYAQTNESANYCACECSESLFNANKENKAKTVDKLSGKLLEDAKTYTEYDPSFANTCFKCKQPSSQSDGVDLSVSRGTCVCVTGCKNKPSDPSKYPYFKFNDYQTSDANTPVCSWSCDVDKLNALVDELNKKKADEELRPFAMDKYKKSTQKYDLVDSRITVDSYQNTNQLYDFKKFKEATSENMRQAQAWYNLAAVIGKFLANGQTNNDYIHIAGCEDRSCKDVYNTAYKNYVNNHDENTYGRFYKFLIYFNDVETDAAFGNAKGVFDYIYRDLSSRASYGTNDQLKEWFKMKYQADTKKCAVYLKEFNYGKVPVNNMWFHGANYGTTYNLACHSFEFDYAKNKDNFKVKNPNTQKIEGIDEKLPTPILRPTDFKGYKGEYGDANYWSLRNVGVIILHSVSYDPLALNMATDATSALKDPTFNEKGSKVSVNLNFENGKYTPVQVFWPTDNYQFLVLKDYAKDNNVSYMFSDVFVKRLNTIFNTGFDQLRTEIDSNKDGLVNANDSKYKDLRLINKPQVKDGDLIQINDKVFEINTAFGAQVDKTGRARQSNAAVYENYSVFRRLLPVDNIDTLCGENSNCVVFDTWLNKTSEGGSAESWYSYSDDSIKYVLKPTGGKPNKSYNFIWSYASGSGTPYMKDAVLLHKINGKYYREIQAKITDIIFKSTH